MIALTAQACQTLDMARLPYEPVCRFADTRGLALADQSLNLDVLALAREIDAFVGARYAPAQFDGPGFMSGLSYYLQYYAHAIAKRAHPHNLLSQNNIQHLPIGW